MSSFNCQPLYETFDVYVSPTAYVFEPSSAAITTEAGRLGGNEKNVREALHVDRKTGQLSLSVSQSTPLGAAKVIPCYGILGMISLAMSEYVVIITQRTPSCRLLSNPIFLATDFKLLPLNAASSSQAIIGNPTEKELVALVEQGLRAGNLWFSHGWDLTNTLQRQKELEDAGKGPGKAPLWQRADERFFWNRSLMSRFIEMTERGTDLSRFILPAMFGSVELRSATINNRDFLFCLIARRSRHRVGTRYFSRGIDENGDVSNFNETEQIALLDPLDESGGRPMRGRVDGRERLSFVQIRGSVPVFWAEINNLRYKPDLQIMDLSQTAEAYKTHMHALVNKYGMVYSVNLVNQKGYEQPVKEAFERQVAGVGNDKLLNEKSRYMYWDFHAECRGMRFDRIQQMVDLLAEPLSQMGWFHAVAPAPTSFGSAVASQVLATQQGVIRSNCMDCLDRTNVAQSALGKWALNNQLRQVGILSHKESIEDHPAFMSTFRNVWADHADSVSKAYSGTGALKTDFTRTGQRTKEGMLQDGINSVMRYLKNNFFDGDRQDAYDLVTGAYAVRRGAIPPLNDTRSLLIRAMPYVLVFALTMIFAALSLPRSSEWSIYSFLFLWILLAFVSASFIWGNGTSYVAWPRLNPPFEILSYEGQGFKTKPRGRGMSIGTLVPSGRKRGAGRDDIELKKKGSLID